MAIIVLGTLETSPDQRPRTLCPGGDRRSRAHHDNRAAAGDGKRGYDQLDAENALSLLFAASGASLAGGWMFTATHGRLRGHLPRARTGHGAGESQVVLLRPRRM